MKYFKYYFSENFIFYKFLLLVVCTTACVDKKEIFEAKVDEKYEIEYKKDTILISHIDIANNETTLEKYFKGLYGYYLIENNQKKIFFSTSKDTIFDNNDEFLEVETRIKKIDNNKFETSTILINDRDSIVLTKFSYDKDYKIIKIQKNNFIEFKPK